MRFADRSVFCSGPCHELLDANFELPGANKYELPSANNTNCPVPQCFLLHQAIRNLHQAVRSRVNDKIIHRYLDEISGQNSLAVPSWGGVQTAGLNSHE